jgi:hypothetical protein
MKGKGREEQDSVTSEKQQEWEGAVKFVNNPCLSPSQLLHTR